ncbi:MAG: Glu-tRNA(Gln) amidotransferase GatDE subunit E [Candidatus Syntrophosphaera sp.]|nr:Glu-tRNA(Gln) amidotransferase GatDE subunit E [Candidatus Syntrophosphaera sp.]
MDNPHQQNWLRSRVKTGWVALRDASAETWSALGFKCGLEVHQQLNTAKKLFCRCPAGIYHDFDDFDAEIVRHMRPTLSELGEYDGTALMEFKTRKKIVYRIKNDSACTYEVDDTPPFALNREALDQAMLIALLLKMKIVGELHITRKQYLDGSIPTGFQRTTILGIEGEFPISGKKIRVIQFSVEEDSCREVSDIRHTRTYYADRLGMPLIETVTYPDMKTPWEAHEAAQNIRFIARSSGLVRVGIGAAREDVNVSVTGGTRVEIKGVAHISWIPKLTHNEAFRQHSLLLVKAELAQRIKHPDKWGISHSLLDPADWRHIPILKEHSAQGWKLLAVNLPRFGGILSWFNQPGRCFADEIADRLKVIACLERPNMFHSEDIGMEGFGVEEFGVANSALPQGSQSPSESEADSVRSPNRNSASQNIPQGSQSPSESEADSVRSPNRNSASQKSQFFSGGHGLQQDPTGTVDEGPRVDARSSLDSREIASLDSRDWDKIRSDLKAGPDDAQILFWAPDEDIKTALETIAERCQLAFAGVPNETRKSLPDGITWFERVLPGADRMYPDTDSAPIPVLEEMIEDARKLLPVGLDRRLDQLAEWGIPFDAYTYLLRNNLMPVLEEFSAKYDIAPKKLALLYAHLLKGLQGREPLPFDHQRVEDLLIFIDKRNLKLDILPEMLKVLFANPNMQFASVLAVLGHKETPTGEILAQIPLLRKMWARAKTPGLKRPDAASHWMMGRLRQMALGNISLAELRQAIENGMQKEGTDA